MLGDRPYLNHRKIFCSLEQAYTSIELHRNVRVCQQGRDGVEKSRLGKLPRLYMFFFHFLSKMVSLEAYCTAKIEAEPPPTHDCAIIQCIIVQLADTDGLKTINLTIQSLVIRK